MQPDMGEVQPSFALDSDADYPMAFDNVPGDGELSFRQKQAHDDLLAYLKARLDSDQNRSQRALRYGRMDRTISTWQKLDEDDTKRAQKQDATGQSQAIAMNLPLTHTHVDDMVSFFAEVYDPSTGAYGSVDAKATNQEKLTEITNRMNADASASDYYANLTLGLRSLIKYNIGGYELCWDKPENQNSSEEDSEGGMNIVTALDMYNFWWDPAVKNPMKIREKAEWAAYAYVATRMELVRGWQSDNYAGIGPILSADSGNTQTLVSKGRYYKYPPVDAGVDNQDDRTNASIDWNKWNASFGNTADTDIRGGYEVIKMFCWLNPADFGLSWGTLVYPEDGYFLWEFKILAGERIIGARPVLDSTDKLTEQKKLAIPFYVGYLQLDDMMGAERSIAELMGPFQSFSSFLLNAHVQGARSSIWGLKYYDPTMFDINAMDNKQGVTGYIPSKVPGRDVRTGMQEMKGTYDGSKTMDQVGAMMQLTQSLFPSQAMPSQIAGLDRATTNQVSAIMQGVSRRLQMLVKVTDESIFNPLRFDQYRNLVTNEAIANVAGLKDNEVRKALGSGLAQLQQEIAEQAIRQILQTMMQSQQLIQQYDIASVFNFWMSLLKLPVSGQQFKLQPNPNPPPQPGAAPAGEGDPAAAAAIASGMGGAPTG